MKTTNPRAARPSRRARLSLLAIAGLSWQLAGCGEVPTGDDTSSEDLAPAAALSATKTDLAPVAASPVRSARPELTPDSKSLPEADSSATKAPAVEAARPTAVDTSAGLAPGDLSLVSGGTSVAPPYDAPTPTIQALEVGDGWKRVQVVGSVVDGVSGSPTTVADEYIVINGRASIGKTSLSEAVRAQLANKMKNVAPPDAGDEELLIVPRQRIETAAVQAQSVSFFSLCDDDNNKTYEKGYSFDRTFPYHVGTTGNFSGSGDFTAQLKGQVTGRVKYSVKYSWCIPTLVIHRVSVAGNADVVGDAKIDASFADTWAWSKKIAEPVLGTITLPILPVPVTFTAPITIGIDASAKAELHLHAGYEAHGAFNISCNGNGCGGTKSASHSFTPNGAPTANFTGTLTVNPWIKGTIHAKVVEDWVAYAEAGVRANLKGTLWAQYGNGCGDADNDRVPEWVSATTLDLGIGIDIVADASFLGSSIGPWTWPVWNRHLAFWKFGDASALNPIFYTQSVVQGASAVNMVASMRSCWPYNDDVTYRVTWNDGTTTDHVGAAKTLLAIPHAFPSYGRKLVHVEAVRDAAGRVLGGATDRPIYLMPYRDTAYQGTGGVLSASL